MRNRSPAKMAASSPPVPPRISRMALVVLRVGGNKQQFDFLSSSSGIRTSQALASSRAISFISGSDSVVIICFASSSPFRHCIYSLRAFSNRSYPCIPWWAWHNAFGLQSHSGRWWGWNFLKPGYQPFNFSSGVFNVTIYVLFVLGFNPGKYDGHSE